MRRRAFKVGDVIRYARSVCIVLELSDRTVYLKDLLAGEFYEMNRRGVKYEVLAEGGHLPAPQTEAT